MEVDTTEINTDSDYDLLQALVQKAIEAFNVATNYGESVEEEVDETGLFGEDDGKIYGNDVGYASGNNLEDVNETTVDYENYTPEPVDPEYDDYDENQNFDDLQTNVAILVDKLVTYGYNYMNQINKAQNNSMNATNDAGSDSTPSSGQTGQTGFMHNIFMSLLEFLLKRIFNIDITSSEYKEKYTYLRAGLEKLLKNTDANSHYKMMMMGSQMLKMNAPKVALNQEPKVARLFLKKNKN